MTGYCAILEQHPVIDVTIRRQLEFLRNYRRNLRCSCHQSMLHQNRLLFRRNHRRSPLSNFRRYSIRKHQTQVEVLAREG